MTTNEFSYGIDGETFSCDTYPTRELALAEALDSADPGETVYTGRHEEPPTASEFMPDADRIIEIVSMNAFEEFEEFADDWPRVITDEHKAQIQSHLDAIADLIQSIHAPKFFRVVDIEPHLVPEA